MSEDAKTYPGVELAYPIAVASYDIALRRLDVMDGRLQTLMAFIVAVSAAVPSIAVSRGIHFRSYWFYGALISFILAIAIGTYARLSGKIKVLKPEKAFNHWLHKPDWEFKKDFIAYAADDFQANIDSVEFKWQCSVAITVLFSFQTVFLAGWVVAGS